MCNPAFGMNTSRLPSWTQILNIPHIYYIYIYIQSQARFLPHPSQKDCQPVIVFVSIRLHQDTIGKCTCHRPPGMAGWPIDSWLVFSHALVSASPPPWSTKKMRTNTLRKIVACLKQYLPHNKKCNMLSPYSQTFNPSIIARMAGFRSLNQSSPKVNPKITKTFYCKKGWGAQEAPQKNQAFLTQFCRSQNPNCEPTKHGVSLCLTPSPVYCLSR